MQTFGSGVRAQVFEVIVRQAMAGAPWREICAGPMRVNNITEEEIEVEVARRRGLGLQCFSKEQMKLLDDYIEEWRARVELTKPGREQDLLGLEKNVRPFVNTLYQTLELPPPAVVICESPLKRILYEHALALRQSNAGRRLPNRRIPNTERRITIEDLANNVLSNLDETQKSSYLVNFQSALSRLVESGIADPGPSLSDKLSFHFFQKLAVELKGRVRDLLKIDPTLYFGAGFNFRMEPTFQRLRTVFDTADEELLIDLAQPGDQPTAVAGGRPPAFRAQFAVVNNSPFLPAVNQALIQSTWGVWQTDLILGAGFLKERLPELGGFLDPCDSELQNWLSMFWLAPWYAFSEHVCYVGAYPIEAHFNETNRLHNQLGPAVTFADGWSVWALDGVRSPRKFVETPELITVDDIKTTHNVALRRLMIESFGAVRYMTESGSRMIDSDEYGELYQQDLPGDEPLTMLRVINSTPEPDGSYKTYFLRVPPQMRTAKEAVAWTFSMDSEEYKPATET